MLTLRTAQRHTTASRSMRPPMRGQQLWSGLKGGCKMPAQTCNWGHLIGGGAEAQGGVVQPSTEKRRRLRERRKATLLEPIFSGERFKVCLFVYARTSNFQLNL